MPSHQSSTSQRVTRILDAARASALSGAAEPEPRIEADPVDAWPDSWPPGVAAEPLGPIRAGARWDVSGRVAVAAAGLLVLVVAIVIVLLSRGPSPGTLVPAAATPPFSAGVTSSGTSAFVTSAAPAGDPSAVPIGTTTSPAGMFRVYVVGQVRRPGVVSLAPGARVEDAVDAAGGQTAKADLTVMNLARKVVDGERIVVPRPGQKVPTADPMPAPESGDGTAAGPGATAVPGAPVDLNSATVADLDALPGVGPVIAGRIVEWRQQNGSFKTVDDLGQVSGIGDATLARLRPLVRV